MSRKARVCSRNGVYHIVARGINKSDVFIDDEDKLKLLYIMKDLQEEEKFQVFAYCIMTNHIHLLLRCTGDLGGLMHRMLLRYAGWYNRKYERCGHLFQNRYSSKPVETADYFLAGLQYIFNNPVKAGMCRNALDYKWSSLQQWYMQVKGIPKIIVPYDKLPIKPCLMDSDLCVKNWEPADFVSDATVRQWTMEMLQVQNWQEVQDADGKRLRECVQKLISQGASIRAIGRVLGMTRYSMARICKELKS